MSKNEPYVKALLDNFIQTASFDLDFTDDELVSAILRRNQQYRKKWPEDDDAITKKWRDQVMAILATAQAQLKAANKKRRQEYEQAESSSA
jgi:hypothetical protein